MRNKSKNKSNSTIFHMCMWETVIYISPYVLVFMSYRLGENEGWTDGCLVLPCPVLYFVCLYVGMDV